MSDGAPSPGGPGPGTAAGTPLPLLIARGRGEPVLLIHGLGASSHVFEPLVARGENAFRFLSVDLPHSGAGGPYASMDPAALAEVLASALTREGFGAAFVVGHSFGGLVALELAARRREQVRGLVVLSCPAFGPGWARPLLSFKAAERAMEWVGRLPRSRRAVRLYLERIWGSHTPLTEAHVEGYLGAMRSGGFFPALWEGTRALLGYRLPADALKADGVPVRLLWGREDRLVPVSQGERLARALSCPLEVLDGTGHCVPEERPDALLSALRALAAPGSPARCVETRRGELR